MPEYEFICRDCKQAFSKILTLAEYEKDKAAMPCPHCASTKTERRWTPFFAVTSKKS